MRVLVHELQYRYTMSENKNRFDLSELRLITETFEIVTPITLLDALPIVSFDALYDIPVMVAAVKEIA